MNEYYKINIHGKNIEILSEDAIKANLNSFIYEKSASHQTGIRAKEDSDIDTFLQDVKELQEILNAGNSDMEDCIVLMSIQLWDKTIYFTKISKRESDNITARFTYKQSL